MCWLLEATVFPRNCHVSTKIINGANKYLTRFVPARDAQVYHLEYFLCASLQVVSCLPTRGCEDNGLGLSWGRTGNFPRRWNVAAGLNLNQDNT